MDIKDLTWEQKALIGIAAITILVLVIAYNPFKSTGSVENVVDNSPLTFQSTPQSSPFNTNTTQNNTTSNATNNTNLNITSDQAKEIAKEAGYTTGQPTQGSIVINNQTVSVWIVPLYKYSETVKEVYVDIATGNIVATRDMSENQQSSNTTQK